LPVRRVKHLRIGKNICISTEKAAQNARTAHFIGGPLATHCAVIAMSLVRFGIVSRGNTRLVHTAKM
jgi:hypothetical protein